MSVGSYLTTLKFPDFAVQNKQKGHEPLAFTKDPVFALCADDPVFQGDLPPILDPLDLLPQCDDDVALLRHAGHWIVRVFVKIVIREQILVALVQVRSYRIAIAVLDGFRLALSCCRTRRLPFGC